MIKHALDYAAQGRRIIPCNGKRPIPERWQTLGVPTPEQITEWWGGESPPNIGWIMGGPDRLVCLDADGPEGDASLIALPLTNTLHALTGSGKGSHRIYRVPAHQDITRIRNRRVAPGLDVKCERGQIIVEPSVHVSGGVYRWSDPVFPIADLPDDIYAAIAEPEAAPDKPTGTEWPDRPEPLADRLQAAVELARTLPPAVQGQDGHVALLNAAGDIYWGCAIPRDKALQVLTDAYNPRCSPPWEARELVIQFSNKLDEVEKSAKPWGYLLLERAFTQELARELPSPKVAEPPKPSGPIAWIRGDALFAELPETKWVVPGLEICPGRPNMFAGYGFSGKTMSAQAMALAFAAGVPVWQKYVTTPGQVRHFDHEQGKHATLRRYQRLAIGLGITREALGSRLGVASFPDIRLTEAKAKDAYCRECEEVDLAIIDSLRAVVPGVDENDSNIRRYIDILSAVSEATGTAFLLIHHSGKGEGEHASIRGSSAIFDSCGCVFELKARKDKPITVTQKKGPAEGEGSQLVPFGLEISDVPVDNNPKAGVRVVCVEPAGPPDAYELRTELVLEYVTKNPGASLNKIQATVGGNKGSLGDLLTELEGSGQVVRMGTSTHQNWYTPASLQTR